MTIIDRGGYGDGAFECVWQPELVPDESRTPCLDGVVVRHGVDGPDLVVVDEVAGEVDGAVGEAVRSGFERSIFLEISALVDPGAGRVFDGELHPRFIQVAHLWDKGVADVLVLDDNVRLDQFRGLEVKGVLPSGAMSLSLSPVFSAKISTLR